MGDNHKVVYVTMHGSEGMYAGAPVKAYLTEDAAKKAVAEYTAARNKYEDKFAEIWGKIDFDHREYKDGRYRYKSADGSYYLSPEAAACADKWHNWCISSEGEDCTATWEKYEEYYEEVELVE